MHAISNFIYVPTNSIDRKREFRIIIWNGDEKYLIYQSRTALGTAEHEGLATDLNLVHPVLNHFESKVNKVLLSQNYWI
jgi:hypothetical protein